MAQERGPFLRSAADSDFPSLVRSVTRKRLAATVFLQSKPINWVRFLQKMLMFLTEKTKTDFAHILVSHWLVLPCQQSGMPTVYMFASCRPGFTKAQLATRSWVGGTEWVLGKGTTLEWLNSRFWLLPSRVSCVLLCPSLLLLLLLCCILLLLVDLSQVMWAPRASRHLGSIAVANWVSFDFNVS